MRGRFVEAEGRRLLIRGVSYGTFAGPDGSEFPARDTVGRDLDAMVAAGFNTVRTYTVPPRWLLDEAARRGLRLMVGVPWEAHSAVLESRRSAARVVDRIREGVRACAGHPAVLCYSVGNEIPAAIVRWHGVRPVERFVTRLHRAAREEDPGCLVTYSSYPSTEYLELPASDLICFNVYLEDDDAFAAYLDRLHTLAGDRPLVLTELGLDSGRNGPAKQASVLGRQVRVAMRSGCAGAVVFSWTDEWHRGGQEILDWSFGLTTRSRAPKPALASVSRAFARSPFAPDEQWPSVSVVLCTHNGARTLAETCRGLAALDYPGYEVVVVDDGSTDGSAAIAEAAGLRVVSTANHGLSSARNTGIAETTGDVVAFIDDDAVPDPQWLRFLVDALRGEGVVGAGGPNPAPEGRTRVERAMACAPGGPREVMLGDRLAEHVPGCNMAFWRDRLEALDGFDPRFRVAGDDVDLCWRLQDAGGRIAFAPAAVVWHRRRGAVGAFWRQQRGYGRAEALLERKWPARYNALGHIRWAGLVYGGSAVGGGARRRIRHGVWGLDEFQEHRPLPARLVSVLPCMPEWNLGALALAALALLGLAWSPLLAAAPLALLAFALTVSVAVRGAHSERARMAGRGPRPGFALVVLLHLVQPLARLRGRAPRGLTPWRRRGWARPMLPRSRHLTVWSERWRMPADRLLSIEDDARSAGFAVRRGGEYDRWDLEIRGGSLAAVRVLAAVEEHGAGRQLLRFRSWPRVRNGWVLLGASLGLLGAAAARDGETVAAAVLLVSALLIAGELVLQASIATGAFVRIASGSRAESAAGVVAGGPSPRLPVADAKRTVPTARVAGGEEAAG